MIGYYGILRANAGGRAVESDESDARKSCATPRIAARTTPAGVAGALSRASNRCSRGGDLPACDRRRVFGLSERGDELGGAGLHPPQRASTIRRRGLNPVGRTCSRGQPEKPGPVDPREPDDLCVMPYTSGTTGQPKGCMHTHRNRNAQPQREACSGFALQPEFTLLAVAPMFHVTGMQGGLNGPLFTGNTMVFAAPAGIGTSPAQWCRALQRSAVGPPFRP